MAIKKEGEKRKEIGQNKSIESVFEDAKFSVQADLN